MAKGEQFQVTQRKVIGTIEDQHKYDMPDGRRLRVNADALRMPAVVEAPTGALQLAEALATVKPTLMDWVTDKMAEQQAADFNQGQIDATAQVELTPEQQQSEWRRKGYEHQKAFLQGEDLGSRLEAEIANKDPSVPFDQWYKEWWDKNAGGLQVNPEFSPVFNRSFTKSLIKARDFDVKAGLAKERADQMAVATENTYRIVKEIRSKGLPITTSDWKIIKDNNYQGFSNADTDELFLNAIERYAKENDDPDALNVLYEKRGDIPALIDNPKYTQKIVALRETLVNQFVANKKKADEETTKAVKEATDRYEQDIRLQLAETTNIEDPVERSKRITEIFDDVKLKSERLLLSDGLLNLMQSSMKRTDKEEETAFQQQEYRKLYRGMTEGRIGMREVDAAIARGDITQSAWQKLVDRRERDLRESQRAAEKGEKPVQNLPEYREAKQSINRWAGYNPMNISPDSRESQANADAGFERFKDVLDDQLDQGVDRKTAIAKAKEASIQYMKEAGLASKDRMAAQAKMEKVDLIRQNPVGYYSGNLLEFDRDSRTNSLPKNIPPADLRRLQEANLNRIRQERKKPKDKKVN